MAIEDGVSNDSELPTRPELKRIGSRVLRGVILIIAAIVWIAFWGLVTRLHVQQDDIVSAFVVSILFVLPAIVGSVYYLRLKVPIN